MCLFARSNRTYTSKKDKIVYKKVFKHSNNKLRAPYRDYYYSPNEFEPKVSLRTKKTRIRPKPYTIVTCGYHSFTSIKAAMTNRTVGAHILQAIIPAGTKYMYSYCGKEIVAEQIKILYP